MPRRADEVIEAVIADDDERFRRVVAAIVGAEADMVVAGQAADGAEAVAVASAVVPDVVLLDVAMPGTDGIEAARSIAQWLPTATVVMLTVSDEEDDVYKALRAGAGGYLLKDTALVDIAASIRTAASGQAVLSPTMAAKLVEDFARPIP
ncbi:MAG: response regulator, partial [Acidimicrobiales bacterium]